MSWAMALFGQAQGLHTWWRGWSRDPPCTTTVQGQKVKGQGHTQKIYTVKGFSIGDARA